MQGLALMVPLAAIGVALGAESASSPAAASGIDSCPSADPDPDYDAAGGGGGRDVSRDLMRQVDFATRAGIDPITVVVPAPDAEPSRGRDLVYAGDGPLPPGGAVGLYRALLVREDAWAEVSSFFFRGRGGVPERPRREDIGLPNRTHRAVFPITKKGVGR